MKCDRHGAMRGFIVCIHVFRGEARATHVTEPTAGGPEGLGEALCAACEGLPEYNVDDLRLGCERCVRELLP